MLSSLGSAASRAFRATAPDPFVIAILLTLLTIALAVTLGRSPDGGAFTITNAVDTWAGADGVWSSGLMRFAMQMCWILITGHALASSPPVARLLTRLASIPRSTASAIVLVTAVGGLLCLLNWGLGLIAGALLAREVGKATHDKGVTVHYPLLCAAGYAGFLLWHGGLSGSAPLKVTTTEGLADIYPQREFPDGPPIDPIPLTDTVFSPLNITITLGLLVIVPTLLTMIAPKPAHAEPITRTITDDGAHSTSNSAPDTRAGKGVLPRLLEDTPLVTALLVALIGIWASRYYLPGLWGLTTDAGEPVASGIRNLTPDTVNLTILMLGLALHATPASYLRAVQEAVKGCAGIIIQFPLYAGIMGLMAASGLSLMLTDTMVNWSTGTTLPVFTYASAGVVNLFVPSGGGQWAVQGRIALDAATQAGVDPAKAVLAVAHGDALTNMLQPFWALPLLAITRVKARDIVGYTVIVMVAAGLWTAGCLLLF